MMAQKQTIFLLCRVSESCLLERRNNGNWNGATNDGQTTVSFVLVFCFSGRAPARQT
jgi:hypothetical protein